MLKGNFSWPNLLWDMGAKEKGWKMETREMFLPTSQEQKDSRRKIPGKHPGSLWRVGCPWNLHSCEMSPWKIIFFSEFASPKMQFVPTHKQDSFQTGSFHQLKGCGGSFELKSWDSLNGFPNLLEIPERHFFSGMLQFFMWSLPTFEEVKNDPELVLWHQVEKFLVQVKQTLKGNVKYN